MNRIPVANIATLIGKPVIIRHGNVTYNGVLKDTTALTVTLDAGFNDGYFLNLDRRLISDIYVSIHQAVIKSALLSLIREALDLIPQDDVYTDESLLALSGAVETAQSFVSDAEATQEEINDEVVALRGFIDALEVL